MPGTALQPTGSQRLSFGVNALSQCALKGRRIFRKRNLSPPRTGDYCLVQPRRRGPSTVHSIPSHNPSLQLAYPKFERKHPAIRLIYSGVSFPRYFLYHTTLTPRSSRKWQLPRLSAFRFLVRDVIAIILTMMPIDVLMRWRRPPLAVAVIARPVCCA